MNGDELRRRSRWIMRALEWDDPRARYPNIWHEGMPRNVLAFDTVACRLRLGDLIAVFHPSSKRHPERANRFLGITRVVGLRRAEQRGFSWVDLETAHRFSRPMDLGDAPRRVFLCSDPGWPQQDVSLFEKVLEAAVAAGWQPGEHEGAVPAGNARSRPVETKQEEPAGAPAESGSVELRDAPADADEPEAIEAERDAGQPGDADAPEAESVGQSSQEPQATSEAPLAPDAAPSVVPLRPGTQLFGGVDYSGDMRDPRDGTWLALLELRGERLHCVRLEPTGRHGLQSHLRDPDTTLMQVSAIGLDFPFGLPLPFAERLLEGPFPGEGWWALARRFERLSRPSYLIALQEFRDERGELKRVTDEKVGAFSPLHRVNPDLGPMTYHGIRTIAEERSRYAVKPFESARGRLLLEIYPGAIARQLRLAAEAKNRRLPAMIQALAQLEHLPVVIEEPYVRRCLAKRDALDAVIAARCAALAVTTGEAEKTPEQLAPDHGERVRLEGWIYGVA